MFKGKREERPRKSRTNANIGIFDLPNIDTMDVDSFGGDDEEGDDDLEAELIAIMGGSGGRTATRSSNAKIAKMIPGDLDTMIAASMKDIASDEESVDENDPDLLAELNLVTGEEKRGVSPLPDSSSMSASKPDLIKLLNERITNYREAETNAKLAGDSAKSRRLSRGLKTLGDLLKKAEKGIAISEDDIPLQVATGSKKPEAQPPIESPSDDIPETLPTKPETVGVPTPRVSRPAPPPPVPPRLGVPLPGLSRAAPELAPPPGPSRSQESEEDGEKEKTIEALKERRDEYKRAALTAKRNGDMQEALANIKIIKQFDAVIAGVEGGQPVDLSAMPPPPSYGEAKETPPLNIPELKLTLHDDAEVDKKELARTPIEQEKHQEKSKA